MTESAFFASAGQKECFTELNVERFEVVGTFDGHMCEDCGDYDGTTFPMKDFKEGVTAPPFHPWCRCTTAPYFEDMKDIGEGWMRDPETGKGDWSPAEMTYDEWKDLYINKKSTMDDWEKAHYGRNVWSEYNRKKSPGTGTVDFEKGYAFEKHKAETDFSQWLHETLGGDVLLLNDQGKADGIKTPDYLWRGEQWELKSTSTISSVNDAIKRGLKQITSGSGGLILDFGENNIPSIEELKSAIDKRMRWHKKKSVDIMIVEQGKNGQRFQI